MSDNLIKILEKLVAYPTVSEATLPIEECLDYVQNYLSDRGMKYVRHDINGSPSLMATSLETKKPKIILQAHFDVVPASEQIFKLREENGRLYGRGVFDMKFALAAFMKLVDDLKEDLTAYDFGIMLTSDEEIGSPNGVGKLLDLGYSGTVCLLPDAGDNWRIETAQKGVWIVVLSCNGLAVHGSRPWEGDNAIERLLPALQEIRTLFIDQGADSDSLSINKIYGGEVANQVADWAEATLDIRFMSSQSYHSLNKAINDIAAKYEVSLNDTAAIQPINIDVANPHIKSFLEIAEQVKGGPIAEIHSLGNSDAHFFAEHDIPVILMRPDGGAPHSEAEWLDRVSFEKYYLLVKAYVQKEAKV